MIFALAGNQNCGKTTLFNALTGSNQHVGNFPGVTVEQKTGEIKGFAGCQAVDLPGVYSLRSFSAEERVTRDYLLSGQCDAVINVVDSTNIERNLYLTLQLTELHIPMVVALNMMDELQANGGCVDISGLSDRLGVPVVPVAAINGEGLEELMNQAVEAARTRLLPANEDICPEGPVHRCLHAAAHLIRDHAERAGISTRFAAVKLIEGDRSMANRLELDRNEQETLEHIVCQMEAETHLERNEALAAMRYDFIQQAVEATVTKQHESREHSFSRKLDCLLTGKYTAFPIFLGMMALMFWVTFDLVGQWLSDLLAAGVDSLTSLVDGLLSDWGVNPVVHSMVIDGAFAGVGSVLSFLPIILVLFFFLSVMEDTGYMARVAFVMDKPLRKLGLSGRSIVPLLIGFGCTVPAVMASRTMSSRRDRKMTILLTPFMSCSAKIPIYGVFAAAFFPGKSALVMICLYLTGIIIGILAALVLKKSVFRGKPAPFVMELPNYRMPSLRSVGLLLWERAHDFISRAFTVIFMATMIIWFLQTFDYQLNVVSDSGNSLLALVGQILAPVFAPLGIADWRVVASLISGFTAKEAVIGSLAVLLGVGAADLSAVLPTLFTPLAAVSFLVFTLLYTPCAAAIACVKKELGSGLAAFGVAVSQTVIAWIAATVIYQLGLLIGLI